MKALFFDGMDASGSVLSWFIGFMIPFGVILSILILILIIKEKFDS
jgi:hypothetical protein